MKTSKGILYLLAACTCAVSVAAPPSKPPPTPTHVDIAYVSISNSTIWSWPPAAIRGIDVSDAGAASADVELWRSANRYPSAIAGDPDGRYLAWAEGIDNRGTRALMVATPGQSPRVAFVFSNTGLHKANVADGLAWGSGCSSNPVLYFWGVQYGTNWGAVWVLDPFAASAEPRKVFEPPYPPSDEQGGTLHEIAVSPLGRVLVSAAVLLRRAPCGPGRGRGRARRAARSRGGGAGARGGPPARSMPTTAGQSRAVSTSDSSTAGSSPKSPHRIRPAGPDTPSAAASTIAGTGAPWCSWGAKRSSSVVTPSAAASWQASSATRRTAPGDCSTTRVRSKQRRAAARPIPRQKRNCAGTSTPAAPASSRRVDSRSEPSRWRCRSARGGRSERLTARPGLIRAGRPTKKDVSAWYDGTATRLQGRPSGEPGHSETVGQVLALAARPFLARTVETLHQRVDLAPWSRPYCPFCGGDAELALLLRPGETRLACGRCTGVWPFPEHACPHCDNRLPCYQKAFASRDGCYRLIAARPAGGTSRRSTRARPTGRSCSTSTRSPRPLDAAALQRGYLS